MTSKNTQDFFTEVSKIFEADQIIKDHGQGDFLREIGGFERTVPGLIKPKNIEQLKELVQLSNKYLVPIYVVSQGKNWGLGSKLPVSRACVVVELSLMNEIIDFNDELGYVRIQPGVTQEQLSNYLKNKNSRFFLDVTGSGAQTSVIGNSLERGVAYNSLRVDTLTRVQVLLANGELINTGFSHLGKSPVSEVFGAGIGPDIKSLFVQSNFGIVTEATIRLQAKTTYHISLTLSIKEQDVGEVLEEVRGLIEEKVISCIPHVFNRERFYPALSAVMKREAQDLGEDLKREEIINFLEKIVPGNWWLVANLSGSKSVVLASKKLIKSKLSKFGKPQFMSDMRLSILQSFFNFLRLKKFVAFLAAVKSLKGISQGIPTDDVLYSVVWPITDEINSINHRDPDAGLCGLLYVVPIIPLTSKDVGLALDLLKTIASHYSFKLSISLNTPNNQFIEGVISVEFLREDLKQKEKAHACIRELNTALIKEGYYPYRIDIDNQGLVVDEASLFWRLTKKLKLAIDPNQVISPGKFEILS